MQSSIFVPSFQQFYQNYRRKRLKQQQQPGHDPSSVDALQSDESDLHDRSFLMTHDEVPTEIQAMDGGPNSIETADPDHSQRSTEGVTRPDMQDKAENDNAEKKAQLEDAAA